MANSNPFLSSSTSRDKYIKSFEEEEEDDEFDSTTAQPTSSGNPFLDAINVSDNSRIKTKKEQEDELAKRRLDELASIEAAAPPKKDVGQTLGDAAGAVGNFLKGAGEAVAENYNRIGQGTANVIGEITGVNQQQRDALTQRANDTQAAMLVQIKNSKDPNRTQEQRDASRKLVEQYTKEQNDIFAEQQGNENRIIEQNDPTKGAAAVAGIGLDVVTGGTVGTAVKGAKVASTVSKGAKAVKTAKQVGAGAGIGAAYGADQAFVTNGADTSVQDVMTGAGTGALIGGAIPIVGKVVKGAVGKGTQKVADKKANKLSNVEAQEAAEDLARRKALGVEDDVQDATQSLTTPPTGTQADEVVQIVNRKTGEKSFMRIPSDKRDEIVAAIDGSENGIAGKDIDHEITHITARSPEDMASKGFKDAGIYGEDPSLVGKAVDNVATPEGQIPTAPGTAPSRYVSKTLPDSDFVGVETKDKLGSTYQQTTNAARADNTLKQLDIEGVDNFAAKVSGRLEGKTITDQTVFDAQGAAQALEKRGDEASLQAAADIYNKLSTKLSEAGQTVQAASIMARQTPEGLSYFAQKQFKKAGVEFTPDLQKQLQGYIADVRNAAPKSPEAAIARDNVQYFIAQNIPSSKADKFVNFWRAGLLTSPTTTGGAIVGNATQAIQKNLITDPISVLADMVLSIGTKKRSVAAADFGSSAKGAIEGAKVLGSKQYRKTGFNPLDPAAQVGKYNEPRTTNYGNGALGKGVGTYVNGVYRVMGAADLPFRNAHHAKAISSLANTEALNRGLKGEEKAKFVADFKANPPKEAIERAGQEAEAAVFGNDTKLGTAASNLAKNLGPVGQILIPFSKVPSAVATKVITSTPLGTAHQIVKQLINVKKGGKFDQRAMAKAIGEGTTGVPILGAGYALGQSGLVTGGYPSTQAERDQWEAEGKKPNSIKIGDKWYSLNYVQPFATLLATGAKAAEAEQAGLDLSEVVSQAAAGAGQSVLSQSFLAGLSNAIDAVKDPAQFGGKFVANMASSIVPNAIRVTAGAIDPLKRDANNPLEGLQSGIPGLRQGLNPKLDDEGQPVQNTSNFVDQVLNPFKPAGNAPTEDTAFNNGAVLPAKRLQAVRKKEINSLLADNKVAAAQRKIDEYNEQVAKVIAPYIKDNRDKITEDQMDKIEKLFLGEVWINKKGRPSISERDDLPK